jgi:CDP-diacylglycerol--glycerol-3-phosphate 3-phosphatidyltransferase
VTFANILTLSRLVTVPLMLLSAWWQRPIWFAWLLGYALVTDMIDGSVARALGQATPFGARLDSIADAAVYLTAPIAALYVYPRLRESESMSVLVVLLSYSIPITVGYLKYKRLTAYHTFAARIAGILLGLAAFGFVTLGVTWPIRAATAVLVLSALEEIAITAILREWTPNVPSLTRVLRRAP